MIRLRASDLDAWRKFVEPERPEFEVSLEDFLAYMKRESPPTDAMRAGSAFHEVMERASTGEEISCVTVDGFEFTFADDLPPVSAPPYREEPCEKVYTTPSGDVLLRGRVDGSEGFEVVDYKLTGSAFDAERYAGSLQWKAYLDMTGGKRFRYVVFHGKRKETEVFVHHVHELTLWAYPEMGGEVQRRVEELAEFVVNHAPELTVEVAPA